MPNKTADAIFSWRISIASLQLATYGWQIGARKLMYSFKNPVSHQCHVLCILYIVQLRISVTSPLPRSFLHTFCDIPHAKVSQLSRPHQKMLVLSSDAGRSWGRRAGEHVPSQQPPAEVIVQFHASDFSGDLDPVLVLTAAECDTLILPSLKCPLFYGASQHFSSR